MIPFPRNNSEFEVHSKLYQALIAKGFVVRGEVKYEHSRFDLVVYDELFNAIAIVEVKNYNNPNQKQHRSTKQMAKYESYGLPVYMCVRIADIRDLVNQMDKDLPV